MKKRTMQSNFVSYFPRKCKANAHNDRRSFPTDELGAEKALHAVFLTPNSSFETRQSVRKIGAGEDLNTDTESLVSSQEDSALFATYNGRYEQQMDPQLTESDANESSCQRTYSSDKKRKEVIALGPPVPLHKRKGIKDSVHGMMYFEPICMRIIDTTQFQRLRHLHQLGVTFHVYIGATHSRFEHSLGVAYLAEMLATSLQRHHPWLPIREKDILCIKIAALCHDLGHGPFSHLFDGMLMHQFREREVIPRDASFLQTWTHEIGSLMMLEHLLYVNEIDFAMYGLDQDTDLMFIKELIYGGPLPENDGKLLGRPEPWQQCLYEIVNNANSGLDVDKLDYFVRDAHHTGVSPSVDIQLIIQSARILIDKDDQNGRHRICYPEKLAGMIMQAFRTRFELHQTVYQHKAICAIGYMLVDILIAANDFLLVKGTRMSEIAANMDAFQYFDDRILAQIQQSESIDLAHARNLLNQIYNKPYYECVGRTAVTAHSDSKKEKELLSEILIASAAHATLLTQQKDAIVLEKVAIHHGKGKQNPLGYVRFYGKHATSAAKCYQLPDELYEMYCPQYFQHEFVRLFVKKSCLAEPLRIAFACWCQFHNQSLMSPYT